MTNREKLAECLSIVCKKINDDLKRTNEVYDYNFILNSALLALRSGESKLELQRRFRHIDNAYFGRGERMLGYIQAGIVTDEDDMNLRAAMASYFRGDEDGQLPTSNRTS